ncbi:MAG: hypothetical protein DWG81_02575, partial [Chloroflexi bacterium]|nr:hypothetical protein [Chloroflexota bacterium]
MPMPNSANSSSATRYELPPEGISLLGYVVRRMHKTSRLQAAGALLAQQLFAEALAQIAQYAAGASSSYGPAYYQPRFNRAGESVAEADPHTGVLVDARLEAERPHLRISYTASLPALGKFSGMEEITGTTVSLFGLGMPAPSRFEFESADGSYSARLSGLIVSELLPGFLRQSRIRAHGSLQLEDNMDNRGKLVLRRNGSSDASITRADGS